MNCGCNPEEPKGEEGYRKWDVEDAVRTLERAEEIRLDKKMMKLIGPMIDKKIKSIEQLRKVAGKKIMEENLKT